MATSSRSSFDLHRLGGDRRVPRRSVSVPCIGSRLLGHQTGLDRGRLLLAVGIVVPLLVGTYDSETPRLGGFPFFFWYQFLLIPIVSALTYVAFRLSESATKRDRRARGLPEQPAEQSKGGQA